MVFLALPVYADELVVNADTGVNIPLLKRRVDLVGVESFVVKNFQRANQNQGIVISNDVVRILNQASQVQAVQNDAAALNAIAPAAGELKRVLSDGGELGKMPLTASEAFARGHLNLGQGARP